MESGFYKLPDSEYFAVSAFHSSAVRKLLRSPAHYKESINKPRTKAMNTGTAFHLSVLEPDEFTKRVVVSPKFDRRTKKGKEDYQEFQESLTSESVILKPEEFEDVQKMAENVLRHREAKKVLLNGYRELAGFWKDGETPCKMKIDYLTDKYCIDLKTTQNATYTDFSRSCVKYGYHYQAALYLRGLRKIAEIEGTGYAEKFIFIAVESSPPYGVNVFMPTEDMLQAGSTGVARAMGIYESCMDTDDWPNYINKVNHLDLPKWAYNKE